MRRWTTAGRYGVELKALNEKGLIFGQRSSVYGCKIQGSDILQHSQNRPIGDR